VGGSSKGLASYATRNPPPRGSEGGSFRRPPLVQLAADNAPHKPGTSGNEHAFGPPVLRHAIPKSIIGPRVYGTRIARRPKPYLGRDALAKSDSRFSYPSAMEKGAGTAPSGESDLSDDRLGKAIDDIAGGETEPIGVDLLVFGSGPLPILGARKGCLAFDQAGNTVLVIALESPTKRAGEQIADELDRLDQLSVEALGKLQTGAPRPLEELHHERFGKGSGSTTVTELNKSQKAIIITDRPLRPEVWKAFLIEIGRRLAGVFIVDEKGLTLLHPPTQLKRRARSSDAWPMANWIGLAAVLLGVGLALLGFVRLTADPEEPAAQTVESPVRDVAVGTPADATHAQWIGQRRLVQTSKGKLIAFFSSPEGLSIVTDQSNSGRSWRSPIGVTDIPATSLSVAIDDRNRVHLAFSDGEAISYTRLQEKRDGWVFTDTLELDETSSPVVDIAWDPQSGLANVVWARESGSEEVPQWAAIAIDGETPSLVQTEALSERGDEIPVLANIAAGPESPLLATYRRGDRSTGWFSSSAEWDEGPESYTWRPEERVPTNEGVGAASLVIDSRRTAHLILRNSGTTELTYYSRTQRGGWSSGETAVDADRVEEIDFPNLTVDQSSRLIYLFLQTTEEVPEIRVAIRDPASGWEGPYSVTSISSVPNGAAYPTSIEQANGLPVLLWTRGGDTPTIQAARVAAP
jgi:hypothetical protein